MENNADFDMASEERASVADELTEVDILSRSEQQSAEEENRETANGGEAREFAVLDKLAAAEGLTRSQYLDKLESAGTKVKPPEEETGEKRTEELKQRLSEFRKLYPDVTRLPDEVVGDISNGTDLIVAYQKYEIRRLKEAAAAAEQNGKNRAKSVGSLADTGAESGRYYSEAELEALQRNGGKRLMEDEVWEKAVRSMIFHQKKKKG